MKKDELLDIILDLPSKYREQLAEEIYQSLKPGEESLNASWIVEANHHMQRLEDTPPALPEEDCNDDIALDGSDETTEVPDHQMIENIWRISTGCVSILVWRLLCGIGVKVSHTKKLCEKFGSAWSNVRTY